MTDGRQHTERLWAFVHGVMLWLAAAAAIAAAPAASEPDRRFESASAAERVLESHKSDPRPGAPLWETGIVPAEPDTPASPPDMAEAADGFGLPPAGPWHGPSPQLAASLPDHLSFVVRSELGLVQARAPPPATLGA
jgi:hypothetical protein